MMIDRLAGNAALKDSVRLMLESRRLTHSVLLVGETGLGAGYAARCVAADYLYPAGGAPAEALLRGECCRAVGKAGDRSSGRVETGIVREACLLYTSGRGESKHPSLPLARAERKPLNRKKNIPRATSARRISGSLLARKRELNLTATAIYPAPQARQPTKHRLIVKMEVHHGRYSLYRRNPHRQP